MITICYIIHRNYRIQVHQNKRTGLLSVPSVENLDDPLEAWGIPQWFNYIDEIVRAFDEELDYPYGR